MFFRSRSTVSHICLDRVENQIGQKYDGLLVEILNVRRQNEILFAVRLAYLGPSFTQRESVEIGNKCAKC